MPRVLISQQLFVAILQPQLPDAQAVADWFEEGQNRDRDPFIPYATITTFAFIEASARADKQQDIHNILRHLKADLIAQKRFIKIDQSMADRFGQMLEDLHRVKIREFMTLEILDAAVASDIGCILIAPKTKALEELASLDGISLVDPWAGEDI